MKKPHRHGGQHWWKKQNTHESTHMKIIRQTQAYFSRRICTGLLILVLASAGWAQRNDRTLGETDIRPFTLGGSVSFLGRGYAVRGIESRRPPGTGQLRVATTFSLFGLQSGLNILYSTDDNTLRQSMNQVSFRGSWRWISVTAGTVSPNYSRYGMSGISVGGGMIELTPGWFHLSLAGGRSRRAVPVSQEREFRQESLERWVYAARLGLGQVERTFFFLSGMYARDRAPAAPGTSTMQPASNILLTPGLRLSMFNNNLKITGEISASVFTGNAEGEAMDLGFELPSFLSDYLTVNTSTRVDYAGMLSADLSLGPLNIHSGIERVQPGFRSLGTGQMRSDHEMYNFRARLPLLRRRVNLSASYSQGRNNLLEIRKSTLERQQIGATMTVRLSQALNFNLAFNQMENENRAVDPSIQDAQLLHQKHVSRNITFSPTLIVRSGQMMHSISATTAYHTLDDQSELVLSGGREAVGFNNITAGISYGTTFPSALSLGLSANMLNNTAGPTSSTGFSANLTGGYSLLEGRLSTNLSLGYSRNNIEFTRILEEPDQQGMPGHTRHLSVQEANKDFMGGEYVVRQWSSQVNLNFSASYRLPNGNPLRFSMRALSNQPSSDAGQEFREVQASLQYTHRF